MLACTSRPQFSLSATNATEVRLNISKDSHRICFPLVSLKKLGWKGFLEVMQSSLLCSAE